MNRAINNDIFALWLKKEVRELTASINSKYDLSNSAELPASCFLWVSDYSKRSTWYIPYRAGTGPKEHGVFTEAGPVSIAVLKAINEAIGKNYPDTPSIPPQIKSKIKKLIKQYNIKEYKGGEPMVKKSEYQISESIIAGQFTENKIDKENRIVKNVAILKEGTLNIYVPGSERTEFSEQFRREIAEAVNSVKFYKDHVSSWEKEKNLGIRSVNDLIGFYENGRYENGVVRADIRYLANQAAWFEPIVEEMADKIGLSIAANGEIAYDPQTAVATVLTLNELRSVDLVTEPGSTSNLYESRNEEPEEEEEKMELSKLTMAELMESRPDIVEKIQGEVKEDLAGKSEIDKLKAENKTLTESNKTLTTKVDAYEVKEAIAEKEKAVDQMIEESKLPEVAVTKTFKESLMEAKDDDARKAIIEDRKAILEGVTKTGNPGNLSVKGMGDENITEANSGDKPEDATDEIKGAFEG